MYAIFFSFTQTKFHNFLLEGQCRGEKRDIFHQNCLLCYIYSMHMSMARNYLKISKNIASLQFLLQKTFYFRNSYFQQIYNCIYMAFIIFFYIKFQNFLENFVIRIFQLRTRIFWNIWIVLSLLSDRKHVSVSQRPIKLIFEIDGFRTFH